MSSEAILTRMELLRIARELVVNEYIDRRAQDHNSWLANSDMAWRTQKVKLPYPAFPAYPSETDIIARANILNEFINGVTPVPSVVVPIEEPQSLAEPALIESVIDEVVIPPEEEPVEEPIEEIVKEPFPLLDIILEDPPITPEAAAIMEIFKPASAGTMDSIQSPVSPSLNSIASAVIDAAATRHDPDDVLNQSSSFSSLLPNWLLKK